jgi:WD40 repeat protein
MLRPQRVLLPIVVSLLAVIASAQEPPTLAKQSRWVTSLGFTADGNQLVTGGGESLLFRAGDVKIWNAKDGSQIASLEGQPTIVWSVALSPDGQKLITSGYDGKIIVWNVAEKKPAHTIEKKGWIRTLALSPDGTKLAAGQEDGNVVLFELAAEGPKELKAIKAHEAAIYDLAFSADGATLATCSTDKFAKLWDWNAGTEKAKLEGHTDAVWGIAFAKDGSLATCSADRKIKLWDAAGKETGTLEGHKDWVSDLAFAPDGATLASASHDKTIKLWSIAEKKETASLGPHKSTLWGLAFSPDGTVLAVGTHNEGVRLWNLASKAEVFPAPADPAAAAAKPAEEKKK